MSPRDNNFDFLRFALAVLVIYSHSWPLLRGSNASEPLYVATGGQISFGEAAVCGFFLISGYLITQSWLRSRTWVDYARKRALRIYPGFVVAMLFCYLCVLPLSLEEPSEMFEARRLRVAAARTIALKDYRDPEAFLASPYPEKINGSTWTIRYEAMCYALMPLALWALRRVPRVAMTLLAAALILIADLRLEVPGLRDPLPRFAGNFFAGACFFLLSDRIPRSTLLAWMSVAALAVAGHYGHLELAMPVAGGYLVFYAAFTPSRLSGWGRFGDFSYGTYLYAFPIQQLLVAALGAEMHPVTLFAVAAPLSVGAGVLSWYLVERRFLHRKAAAPAVEIAVDGPVRRAA